MSIPSLIFTSFPILFYVTSVALFYISLNAHYVLFILLLWLYIVPPLICRCLTLKNGFTDLEKGFSPWWASYSLQRPYYDFPSLERVLRTVPGLYSAWLRLWGAQVGKNVYWTPAVEICDRPLLKIGDNCIFGHRCTLVSHVITPKRKTLILYIGAIEVGANSFIGAGSVLGPGSQVEPNTFLPPQTIIKVGRK